MAGDYTTSNIYQGGYSSLSPSYGNLFTGYRVNASELGMALDPRTANQIQQVNNALNQGIIPIEVGALDPQVFDQIPKQHFKEINRMAKLTGAKVSVHAPLIEPSGIDPEQRRPWDESYRELAERQLNDVVEKSIEMDDKGGMPITIHCSGIPGTEYKMTDDGKKVERLIAINKETGKMAPLEEERKFYPGMKELKPEIEEKLDKGLISEKEWAKLKAKPEKLYDQIPLEKGKYYSPEARLDTLNHTEWDNSISQLLMNKERADEILQQNEIQIKHLQEDMESGRFNPENLTPAQQQAQNHIINVKTYLEDTRQHVNEIFSKAYEYGTEKQKANLKLLSQNFQNKLDGDNSIGGQSKAMQELLVNLKQQEFVPKMYVPIEDFAVEHSAKTFANVAFKAFDKHKDKAPTISIENMYPGMAFAHGEEMDNLIVKSRKKFFEKAIEEGYSKSVAEQQAEKMIGMTFDVGHLNIAKKHGFEDKDLIKEVEKIAKHVKHVHITDNFGYGDSHLPPGMGNVPIKDMLQELEKKGDMQGVRKIVEAGGWFQHFQTSPFPQSLEAMGSPIYSMQMAPYWNQAIGLQQGYSSGYGQILPQINYETFGAGFSQLPAELGGQRGGAQGGRMSGRGME